MPMPDLRPEQCATCATNPDAAPQRWCAPNACVCNHTRCPAYPTSRHARDNNVIRLPTKGAA